MPTATTTITTKFQYSTALPKRIREKRRKLSTVKNLQFKEFEK